MGRQSPDAGTDFTAHQGSVIVRFGDDFMAAQSSGSHTVRVEFLNHYGEATVNVAAPDENTDDGESNTHNPNTGGDTQNPQTDDPARSP